MRKGGESWDCSAWRREGSGGLTNVCKYLEGGRKEDRARLFPVVPSDGTRGHGHKLGHRRVPLNIRERFLGVRVMEHWDRLLGEVVGPPSSEILKVCLDMVLGNWLWVALLEQGGWTRCSPQVPSHLNHSVIL